MNGQSRFTRNDSHRYSAIFHGQLKKQTDASPPFLIPLLVDFDTFLNAYTVLQRKQGDVSHLSNDSISVRYHSNVKRAMQETLPEIESLHDFRGIYIKMVYDAFTFPKMTFARVAMLALGHASLTESLSYNHIALENFSLRLGNFFLTGKENASL
jgi:hypothetical protein